MSYVWNLIRSDGARAVKSERGGITAALLFPRHRIPGAGDLCVF